jgi:mxaA protein
VLTLKSPEDRASSTGTTAPTLALQVSSAPVLKIPATSVNIAPLSPPGSPTQVGEADLRPDRLPALVATAPIRRAAVASSGALVLTLAAWFGWIVWRNRRAMATQPFARALREMRALDDREPRAWQVLHQAFDRTAGRVIHNATLPELFERAPQLAPARTRIERFFAESSLRFFAKSSLTADEATTRKIPDSGDAVSPRALCAELRRIERRYER